MLAALKIEAAESSKKGMADPIKVTHLKVKANAHKITKTMVTTIKTVTINQTIKIVNKLDVDSHKYASVRIEETIVQDAKIIETRGLYNNKTR